MPARSSERLFTKPFTLLTVSIFLYLTAVGIHIPVLPVFVREEIGRGEVAVGLAMGIFSAAAFVLRPFMGRYCDAKGRRALLLLGSALVAVTSVLIPLSASMPRLLPLRVVAGVGEAALFVAGFAAIDDVAPRSRRGEALSVSTLAIYLGLAVGPVLGEWVSEASGFTPAWLMSAAFGAGAFILLLPVGETRPPGVHVPSGFKLVHPAGVLPGAVLLGSVIGFAGYSAFLKLYTVDLGLGSAGPLFALYSLTLVAFRTMGRTLPDRLGGTPVARVCLGLSATGLLMMGVWRGLIGLTIGTLIFAAGQALTFPSLMMLVVHKAPDNERGFALATFSGFLDLGFGLGPVMVGALVAVSGYTAAFMAAAGAALAALVLLVFADRGAAPVPDGVAPEPGGVTP